MTDLELLRTTFRRVLLYSLGKPFDKSVLNLCNLRRGLADGDFIEVVAETDSYFEIRAVVDSELKFVGAGPSWSEAIALADSWLARHGTAY